jgi:hypothetical protein
MVVLPQGDSPFLNSSYTTTADIEVHEGETEGTIPTPGDRSAELRPTQCFWSYIDLKRLKW